MDNGIDEYKHSTRQKDNHAAQIIAWCQIYLEK